MKKNTSKTLAIKSKITARGINISVLGRNFPVEYPAEIWSKTSDNLKQLLLENLSFGSTHFLPLTLGYERIAYNTALPLFESFLFRNQVMDLLKSEGWDNAPHLSYLQKFYNLDFDFASDTPSAIPRPASRPAATKKRKPVAVIPFTFGKESLTTFALCLELGITPILVYSQEPSQKYEEAYKKKKLAELSKKYGVKTFFLKNAPGLFRYDRAFGKKPGTEVGWGAQTTLLTLQMLPFVELFQADYMLFGSEHANNEFELHEGWKAHLSYDQSSFFTLEQDAMVRLVSGNRCRVRSSLEPIEEINIFSLLHRRYTELGQGQFSCTAEKPLFGGSQWCHQCYKCVRMFLFARCTDIDPFTIGFKKDLLQESHMFDHYFGKEHKSGSNHELDFCFLILTKKGIKSPYVDQFKKEKMKGTGKWTDYVREFTALHPALNLPAEFEGKMMSIFKEELGKFEKILP